MQQEPTCVRCRIEPLSGDMAEQLSDVLLGFGELRSSLVALKQLPRPAAGRAPAFLHTPFRSAPPPTDPAEALHPI
jgi:hypothetical protein